MNFSKPETVYNLLNIRTALVGMEDTIIFNLLERSDFRHSPIVYEQHPDLEIPSHDGSFLDWLFGEHERIQSQVRRFQSPDQFPFYPQVIQESFLPPVDYPKVLADYFREVNINSKIKDIYIKEMVPRVSQSGEDLENIGSTAMTDIAVLQSLSRRIHFGMFVAEAKFRAEREKYTQLIKSKDVEGIMREITNEKVEEMILQRLVEKAKAYGTDPTLKETTKPKIEPEVVVGIYKDWVIPLTKKVEVDYLLRRLEDSD